MSKPKCQHERGPKAELTDRRRWGGDVVAATTLEHTWGTHTFGVRFQMFADGEGHVQVAAPSDPPPSAREIVADGLAGDGMDRAVASVLADEWEIDTAEVTA